MKSTACGSASLLLTVYSIQWEQFSYEFYYRKKSEFFGVVCRWQLFFARVTVDEEHFAPGLVVLHSPVAVSGRNYIPYDSSTCAQVRDGGCDVNNNNTYILWMSGVILLFTNSTRALIGSKSVYPSSRRFSTKIRNRRSVSCGLTLCFYALPNFRIV